MSAEAFSSKQSRVLRTAEKMVFATEGQILQHVDCDLLEKICVYQGKTPDKDKLQMKVELEL